MSEKIKVRDELAGMDFDTFPTLGAARIFVGEKNLDHYQLWQNGNLIEYGRTPTRLRRQGLSK